MGEAWRPTPEVRRVIRNAWSQLQGRGWAPSFIEREDCEQAALIAIWRAWEDIGNDSPKIFVTARSAMIDELHRRTGKRASTREYRASIMGDMPQAAGEWVQGIDMATPDAELSARQMLAALQALPDPWPARIDAILRHDDKCDAAAELRVSPQRLSQYLGHLRQVLTA